MTPSQTALSFLEKWEELRLVPYLDQAGLLTNGYGHLLLVTDTHLPIVAEVAWRWLQEDAALAGQQVEDATQGVTLSQPEFDALTCFAFNVGGHALAISTLAAKLKAGDFAGAADEFLRWDHVRVRGVQMESAGLKARVAAERALFLSAPTAVA